MRPLITISVLIIIAGLGGYWLVDAVQVNSAAAALDFDPFVSKLVVGQDCPGIQLVDSSGKKLSLSRLASDSPVLLVLATHGCGGCKAVIEHMQAVLLHRLRINNVRLVVGFPPSNQGRHLASLDSPKSAGIDCVTIDLPERKKFGLRVSPTLLGIRDGKLVYLQIGYQDRFEESINALFVSANQSFFNYPYQGGKT